MLSGPKEVREEKDNMYGYTILIIYVYGVRLGHRRPRLATKISTIVPIFLFYISQERKGWKNN